MRQRRIIPGVDPKLLIKDAARLMPDASRRGFLRGAASLGALTFLTGCDIIDGDTAENVLRKIVRGLYYHEYHEQLPSLLQWEFFQLSPARQPGVPEPRVHLSPGSRRYPRYFEWRHGRDRQNSLVSQWELSFWGWMVFRVSTYGLGIIHT